MKQKTIQTKKTFEEVNCEDICNFNQKSFIGSDQPETGLRENIMNENVYNINNNDSSISKDKLAIKSKNNLKNRSSSKEVDRNRKTSRKSSKTSFRDSTINVEFQSPLLELVESLKDKLKFYENEVKNLVDEKIHMQMTINNLQIKQMRNSGNNVSRNNKSRDNLIKNSNEFIDKTLKISHESIFDLNNQSSNERKFNVSQNIPQSRKKSEIEIDSNQNINQMKENICRQKNLLKENDSFLEDTLTNINLNEFEQNLGYEILDEKQHNQMLYLRLQFEKLKKKEYEIEQSKKDSKSLLIDLEKQKLFMLSEINKMKDELHSLFEIQNYLMTKNDQPSEKSLSMSNNQILNSNDCQKGNKEKSFENIDENNYLPTNDSFNKNQNFNDEQNGLNLTGNKIKSIKNNNISVSNITYEKSVLNRCFIQDYNLEKIPTYLFSNDEGKNQNIINLSDFENNKYNKSSWKIDDENQKFKKFDESKINIKTNFGTNLPNENLQNSNKKENNISNNNNINNNIGLPNIENFFVLKEKVFLVDNEKTVWHLKKCKRYEKIQKEYSKEVKKSDLENSIFVNENPSIMKNKIFVHFLQFYQGEDGEMKENLSEINIEHNSLKFDSKLNTSKERQHDLISMNKNSMSEAGTLNECYIENEIEEVKERINNHNEDVSNDCKKNDLITQDNKNDSNFILEKNSEKSFTSLDFVSDYSKKKQIEILEKSIDEKEKFNQENLAKKNSDNKIENFIEFNYDKNLSLKNTISNISPFYMNNPKETDKDTTYNLSDDSS